MDFTFRTIRWNTHLMILPTVAIVTVEEGKGLSIGWFNKAVELLFKWKKD